MTPAANAAKLDLHENRLDLHGERISQNTANIGDLDVRISVAERRDRTATEVGAAKGAGLVGAVLVLLELVLRAWLDAGGPGS